MQILRIILMVCFVFTVYPSIGEAVDIEAVDIGEGSKTKPTLKATTSHPLSLNTDTVDRLGSNDSGELAIRAGETLSLDRKGDSWSEEPEKKMSELISTKEGGFQPNTDIKDSLEDDGY